MTAVFSTFGFWTWIWDSSKKRNLILHIRNVYEYDMYTNPKKPVFVELNFLCLVFISSSSKMDSIRDLALNFEIFEIPFVSFSATIRLHFFLK